MATDQVIDIDKFKTQLKNFDALRDTDEIQTGTLPRIQPKLANEWLPELEPSVRDVLNKNGLIDYTNIKPMLSVNR